MPDNEAASTDADNTAPVAAPTEAPGAETGAAAGAETKPRKAARRAPRKNAATSAGDASVDTAAGSVDGSADEAPAATDAPAKPVRRRSTRKADAAPDAESGAAAPPGVLFQAPTTATAVSDGEADGSVSGGDSDGDHEDRPASRRRRRGGSGRSRSGSGSGSGSGQQAEDGHDASGDAGHDDTAEGDQHDDESHGDGESGGGERGSGNSRRRRRRRRRGGGGDGDDGGSSDDPPNTVVRVREPRDDSEVHGVSGSTRLEAKKQRRRQGREQGRRRRGVIVTEAEFLARREAVERVMAVRQRGDRTQIGIVEDGMLVEHFVSTASSSRIAGNVYLGRVQNVLPGMEAAFIDVGKGRNGVLYAGEVNFDLAGVEGNQRRIETVLKSGQQVLVQVTKDPIGHKGARLTSQVSLPGRYLVFVPEGSMTGISRKLPENERARLKAILKQVMPEGAGVIVRTAAEGASEEELQRDVARLSAQWEDIKKKAEIANAPALLYGEPDLSLRVIRDIFNEDFNKLVVSGDDEWDMVEPYVGHVAPDLVERLSRWTSDEDIFTHYRVDEQLAKALDRKVWLPSGGYLIIDRTEAMVVIDVNTGRFVGKGGNLEETVTKNNLEAAEEIVRQLRLRDVGGIIVIDFIDMVLESNRDLVLRRLVECLGRDRTKHQVAEVTSLGLVQMTRKRVGSGLLEAFSETCETCNGRGVLVHSDPVEPKPVKSSGHDHGRDGGKGGGSDGRRRRGGSGKSGGGASKGEASDTASKGEASDTASGGVNDRPKDAATPEVGAHADPESATHTEPAPEPAASSATSD